MIRRQNRMKTSPGVPVATLLAEDLHGGGTGRGLHAVLAAATPARVCGSTLMGPWRVGLDRLAKGLETFQPAHRAILGAEVRLQTCPNKTSRRFRAAA